VNHLLIWVRLLLYVQTVSGCICALPSASHGPPRFFGPVLQGQPVSPLDLCHPRHALGAPIAPPLAMRARHLLTHRASVLGSMSRALLMSSVTDLEGKARVVTDCIHRPTCLSPARAHPTHDQPVLAVCMYHGWPAPGSASCGNGCWRGRSCAQSTSPARC